MQTGLPSWLSRFGMTSPRLRGYAQTLRAAPKKRHFLGSPPHAGTAVRCNFEGAKQGFCSRPQRQVQAALFLGKASAALTESLDYADTLSSLADVLVPELADWCAADVLENGVLCSLAGAYVDPARIELARELQRRYPTDMNAEHGVANVLRTSQI